VSATQAGQIHFATVDISTATVTVLANGGNPGFVYNVVGFWLQMSGTTPTFKFNTNSGDWTGTFDVPGVYAACGERDAPLFPDIRDGNNVRITTTGTISLRGMVAYTLNAS